MFSNRYVLITAARNEEALIEDTIKCVINQAVKPDLWIVVSDDSTDKTDEIVQSYADKHNFISLIRNKKTDNRNFASKVYAVNLALTKVNVEYDFIGILDADITFEPNYYEMIFKEFEKDSKLGLAGGEFFDIIDGKKFRVVKSTMSVRGGIQLFRKECFDQINEFTPLKNGGEDVVTEVTARMNGWTVKSFDHLMLDHNRLTGTGGWSVYEAKFKEGMLAHSMGYHPFFQIFKSVYRIRERPFIISGFLLFTGYIWAIISGNKRKVSQQFISFIRQEQMERMKGGVVK
ncbi:MAG: glycosyltransferase family 2 protein [Melioribacteraceae bacterium]